VRGRFYYTIEHLLQSYTDHHIVVSPEIQQFLGRDGVPTNRISLIPNAIAIDPQTIRSKREQLTASLGLPVDALICCAVGRLVEAKAHTVLVASIQRLVKDIPSLHCLIAGEGPLREPLVRQIHDAQIQEHVHLLGFQVHEEALTLMKTCDIFVMPSRSEGTPVALLEAAALARPIVASRVGGIPSVLEHDQHALLVEAGKPAELAETLKWLIEHPTEAREMGERARNHVRKHFGLEAQLAATYDAYHRAYLHKNGRVYHSSLAGADIITS
jgi:glycosyltransferase involved in cell wall biosynthesis